MATLPPLIVIGSVSCRGMHKWVTVHGVAQKSDVRQGMFMDEVEDVSRHMRIGHRFNLRRASLIP